MLGKDRMAFSYRYCNRRLIPVGRQGSNTMKYDNSGLSRAGELHALLKEVGLLRDSQSCCPAYRTLYRRTLCLDVMLEYKCGGSHSVKPKEVWLFQDS